MQTHHNVLKLSEVHDLVVRWLLKKYSSEYEIGQFPKKGQFHTKKDHFTKNIPVYTTFENCKSNQAAESCTSDN